MRSHLVFITRVTEDVANTHGIPDEGVNVVFNADFKDAICFWRSHLVFITTLTEEAANTHGIPDEGVHQVVVGAEHDVSRVFDCPGEVVGAAAVPLARRNQLLDVKGPRQAREGLQVVVVLHATGIVVVPARVRLWGRERPLTL